MSASLDWILPALASPIVYTLVTLGDKRVLSVLRLNLGSFYLFVGSIQLTIALFIFLILGWQSAPFGSIAASYGAGFLWGAGLMLMFFVLQREEVSRVTPVWQSSPVFVAILAALFLGESLDWQGWLAVMLVVSGAVAVSVDTARSGLDAFKVRPTFFLLIAGAVIIAVAQMLLKIGADDLDVWRNMAFRGIGLFTSLAAPWARPPYPAQLLKWVRKPNNAIFLFASEAVGPFLGNMFLLMAIAIGPVSLVSALFGTRPIWVLLMTVLLGLVARQLVTEQLSGRDLAIKAIATGAVVSGVVLIALQ